VYKCIGGFGSKYSCSTSFSGIVDKLFLAVRGELTAWKRNRTKQSLEKVFWN